MNTKTCIYCGNEKEVNLFYRQTRNEDGFRANCKECFCKKYYPNRNSNKVAQTPKEVNRKEALRRKSNISIRIGYICRSRVYLALKNGFYKKTKTFDLIGCTPEFLKEYLESKFLPGMTWENYGRFGWHIDHILPCSSFDFSDPEQQKKCFHYSNMQPLWWKDNIKKGDKIYGTG